MNISTNYNHVRYLNAVKLKKLEVVKDAQGNHYVKKVILDDSVWSYLEQNKRQLCQFSHPNIVKVHEIGYYKSLPVIIEDYVEGTLLHEYQEQDEIDLLVFCNVAESILSAIQFLQKYGYCNRDIKPDNIIYQPDTGIAVLIDFDSIYEEINNNTELFGTLKFMSPLKVLGVMDDSSTSLFSLGITLLSLFTNTSYFNYEKMERRTLSGHIEYYSEAVEVTCQELSNQILNSIPHEFVNKGKLCKKIHAFMTALLNIKPENQLPVDYLISCIQKIKNFKLRNRNKETYSIEGIMIKRKTDYTIKHYDMNNIKGRQISLKAYVQDDFISIIKEDTLSPNPVPTETPVQSSVEMFKQYFGDSLQEYRNQEKKYQFMDTCMTVAIVVFALFAIIMYYFKQVEMTAISAMLDVIIVAFKKITDGPREKLHERLVALEKQIAESNKQIIEYELSKMNQSATSETRSDLIIQPEELDHN